MKTVKDIFDFLGGYAEAASAVGVTKASTAVWQTRGGIPAEYWHKFVDAGHGAITFELLESLKSKHGGNHAE